MNVSHVICIDFEPGVPGRDIAAEVAETLHLPLLDWEITARAASKLNLSERSVATLEGEPNHPIERWILAAAEGDQAIGLTGPTSAQSDPRLQRRRPLMHAIRDAIAELATFPCVIADHQVGYALDERRDAIRVLLRADRVQRQRWLDEKGQAWSEDPPRPVEKLDRAMCTYIKQAYGRPWPDPRIYHFVIDVDSLTLERSAFLVSEFVRSARAGEDFRQ